MKLLQENHVKYGLIMCGLLALCLVGMLLTGTPLEEKPPVFMGMTMLVPLIVWLFGIRAKKKALKNKLTFKQGVTEGFKISLVYGIISPFVFLIYYFISPGALEFAQTSYNLTQYPPYVAAIADMIIQLVSSLFFGTIYAAIISFFLKSK